VLKDLDWSCKPHRCAQVIEQGLFSGWDHRTVAVLGIVVGKMWFSALVAKVLDSVVKQLGSCFAMVLTYLEVVWIDPDVKIEFETFIALAVVVLAIASFAMSTRDSRKIERLTSFGRPAAADESWVGAYAPNSKVARARTTSS